MGDKSVTSVRCLNLYRLALHYRFAPLDFMTPLSASLPRRTNVSATATRI